MSANASQITSQSLDCLFNGSFWLTPNEMLKRIITGHLIGESTGHRWIPLTKGQ